MRRYFVTDFYKAPDAGAMERDLVIWASRIYKNVLVRDEFLPVVVDRINREQDRLLAEKPRRRKVGVSFTENHIRPGAWVHIGSSTINLALVLGEVYVENGQTHA